MPKDTAAPGSNWAQLKKTLSKAQASNGPVSLQSVKHQQKRKDGKPGSPNDTETAGSSSKSGSGAPDNGERVLTSKQLKSKAMKDFYKEQAAAKKGPWNSGGVGRYMGMEGIAASSSAGPSSGGQAVRIPLGQAREMVKLLPVPQDVVDDPAKFRLVEDMRSMVAGTAVLNEAQRAPGNYIAIDCEMVGLGPQGRESALARVSIVNYHGHILIDTFVSPRETVTDYRTWISGIQRQDLQGAPEFERIQAEVAKLVEGRIVIGHALENDMKALLLSHPAPLIRDTQTCKPLRELAKNKRPGLKKLSEIALGIQIQSGAHSSVTDARATMALYRLHKVEWEQSLRKITDAWRAQNGEGPEGKGKRKRSGGEDDDEEGASEDEARPKGKKGKKDREPEQFPGGGRKGISSNIGMIITHRDGTKEVRRGKKGYVSEHGNGDGGSGGGNWWEESAG